MLQLKNVSVSYGPIDALVNVSIDVPKGSIVSLIGTNGAGKSTLLKSISGINLVKDGSVIFNEQEINQHTIETRSKMGISHVLEGRRIFRNLSIEDNLELAVQFRNTLSRKEKRKLVESELNKYPLLKNRRNEKAGRLSGGQLQLLIFSVATICKPEVLLLDEPSLGLAPLMVQEIYDIVKQLNNDGVTILLAEQLATFALEVSDYAYVLDKGVIVQSGESKKLESEYGKEGLVKAYLG